MRIRRIGLYIETVFYVYNMYFDEGVEGLLQILSYYCFLTVTLGVWSRQCVSVRSVYHPLFFSYTNNDKSVMTNRKKINWKFFTRKKKDVKNSKTPSMNFIFYRTGLCKECMSNYVAEVRQNSITICRYIKTVVVRIIFF